MNLDLLQYQIIVLEAEEGSIGNKSKSESENKQSPIDFVLEKKQCEMADIPDSDGGGGE